MSTSLICVNPHEEILFLKEIFLTLQYFTFDLLFLHFVDKKIGSITSDVFQLLLYIR